MAVITMVKIAGTIADMIIINICQDQNNSVLTVTPCKVQTQSFVPIAEFPLLEQPVSVVRF